MSKKTQIVIVSAAMIFTAFFVWSAFTYDGSSSNNTGGSNDSSQNSGQQKDNQDDAKVVNQNEKSNPANQGSTNGTGEIEGNNKNTGSEAVTGEESNEDFTMYEVQKGDTLKSICKEYSETAPENIVRKAIQAANNLSEKSVIKSGMKLRIPSKYSNGSIYTVKSGDSLFDIATDYMQDMDVIEAINKIKKDNFLTSDNIQIGSKLFLAATTEIIDADSNAAETDNNTANSDREVDDEAYAENGGSVDSDTESSDAEGTTSDKGTEANITYVSYTVKKGETLTSISKKYEQYCPVSVTSKILLKVNNLASASDVKEGVTLNIPDDYIKSGDKYTVASGDTLSGIALSHLKDIDLYEAVEKIKKDNFMANDTIRFGDQIFIVAADLGQ